MQSVVRQERFIRMDIFITLLALGVMSYFYYGFRAIMISGLCMTVSFVCEYFSLIAMNKKFTADSIGCITDGFIIALMMPASIDYKIPVIACVFMNIAGKNIFGGRKNMIFSPAAVGYLFALTSWAKQVLEYPNPFAKTAVSDGTEKLVNSASHIFNTTGRLTITDYDIIMGNFAGPMGAVSILLLVISAVILLFRRDISAGAFIGFIAGMLFMGLISSVGENIFESVKYLFATNMTVFAAVFIISDVRIAPQKFHFSFFYGIFIAFASYILLLTTGKENPAVIVSVLFTPAALGLKRLESRINKLIEEEKAEAEIAEAVISETRALGEEIAEEYEKTQGKISDIADEAIEEIVNYGNLSENSAEEEETTADCESISDNPDDADNQGDDLNKQA